MLSIVRMVWLDSWQTRYGVSFRKINKKYKLSAAERMARLGIHWRDSIRVRKHLKDPPYQAWDQSPVLEDCLEGEEVAVGFPPY